MPRGVVDETPPIRDDYQLALVDGDYFKDKLRPKQFLHIDQSGMHPVRGVCRYLPLEMHPLFVLGCDR